jgi:hypothetical protein
MSIALEKLVPKTKLAVGIITPAANVSTLA